MAQIVKNLLAMQETRVQSLGWEDSLKKEMATYFSILAWRIPWTEEPGELHTVHGVARSDTTERLTYMYTSVCLKFSIKHIHIDVHACVTGRPHTKKQKVIPEECITLLLTDNAGQALISSAPRVPLRKLSCNCPLQIWNFEL